MGLVVNRLVGSVTFPDLLSQLGIDTDTVTDEIRVHFGGPVESGRGFVLHSGEYNHDSTLQVAEQMALTATVDILQDIAKGAGPRRSLLALGYAGWGPGQLDAEIQSNGWLNVEADEQLVFGEELDDKWERAIGKLGIDPALLSADAGHA
jgi:putative transcriptional regulator